MDGRGLCFPASVPDARSTPSICAPESVSLPIISRVVSDKNADHSLKTKIDDQKLALHLPQHLKPVCPINGSIEDEVAGQFPGHMPAHPPMAASRTASLAFAVTSVLSGRGEPVASMAAPPISS